jgi:putative glutamine amidotransferase
MTRDGSLIIGVATRGLRVEGRSRPFLGAYESYLDALSDSGADSLLIPIGANPTVLGRCDGLVLAGGEDPAEPQWWDGRQHASGPLDPRRDASEAALVATARRSALPVLALCRGAQLVNGVMGGTLTRTLPATDPEHGGSGEAFHAVRLKSGSSLAAAYSDASRITVLSRHSALIATLGRGLAASAWADDTSIEGFEAQDWPCIGVLWHAEWAGHEQAPDLSLFRWLAQAAQLRKQ